MKKRRLLVFGLIAALLLTGAAYAAWTDSVDVNVTASTGEAKVIITAATFDAVNTSTHIQVSGDGNGVTIDPVDAKYVNVVFDNLYPAAQAEFEVTVRNDGSIPVSLTDIVRNEGTDGGDGSLFDQLVVSYSLNDTLYTPIADDSTASVSGATVLDPTDTMVVYFRVALNDTDSEDYENVDYNFTLTPVFTQN